MTRQARLHIPNGLFHIINRGLNRHEIFYYKKDAMFFLSKLQIIMLEEKCKCYAWALMKNHFHLLLSPSEISISHIMSRLLTSYAMYFNRKYNRSGKLFQNRYKSIFCIKESHLLELVKYIHLNPKKSKVLRNISDLDNSFYTSHSVIMGNHDILKEHIEEVLYYFNQDKNIAKKLYLDFINQ